MKTVWDGFETGAALALLAIAGFGLSELLAAGARTHRRRRTSAAAHRLLRRDRPRAEQRWPIDDWSWALRKIGTPEALRQLAIHTSLQHTAQ